MNDAEHLAHAIEIIRTTLPDAVSAELQTSDQDTYGFILTDVTLLGDDDSLADMDPDALAKLDDALFDDLKDLAWDGVVGENGFGTATVEVMTPKVKRIREAEAEYLPDGDVYGDSIDLNTADRWLLVERNDRGSNPPYYLTTHASPGEAHDYRVNQEYASDWKMVELIDLDTGEHYDESDYEVTISARLVGRLKGAAPSLAGEMREAIAPLIAFRDKHYLDPDNYEDNDGNPWPQWHTDAAEALDRAFDHIDSAIRSLEEGDE